MAEDILVGHLDGESSLRPNTIHCCLYVNLVVIMMIMIPDNDDNHNDILLFMMLMMIPDHICDDDGDTTSESRQVVSMVVSYLLSCFEFPNGNVESAKSPCN